jgi:hypothetical protein
MDHPPEPLMRLMIPARPGARPREVIADKAMLDGIIAQAEVARAAITAACLVVTAVLDACPDCGRSALGCDCPSGDDPTDDFYLAPEPVLCQAHGGEFGPADCDRCAAGADPVACGSNATCGGVMRACCGTPGHAERMHHFARRRDDGHGTERWEWEPDGLALRVSSPDEPAAAEPDDDAPCGAGDGAGEMTCTLAAGHDGPHDDDREEADPGYLEDAAARGEDPAGDPFMGRGSIVCEVESRLLAASGDPRGDSGELPPVPLSTGHPRLAALARTGASS